MYGNWCPSSACEAQVRQEREPRVEKREQHERERDRDREPSAFGFGRGVRSFRGVASDEI